MSKIRKAAGLLAVVMMMSVVPKQLFASIQNPVKKIIDIVVEHTDNKNNDVIIPKVNATWERPENNPSGDQVDDYLLTLKDYGKLIPGSITHKVNAGTSGQMTYEIGAGASGVPLKSGVFYEMNIQARHHHSSAIGGATDTAPVGAQSTGYFITNFDTTLKGKRDKLELTWEYIPHINYKVFYAQGDYGKIEDFPLDGITDYELSSTQVQNLIYQDESTGRKRIKYVIDTNIVPGQVYSAYVVPVIPKSHPLVSDTVYQGNSAKVAVAVTEVDLKVFNIGNSNIRLEWNIEPSIMSGKYQLVESKIYGQPIDGQPYLVYTFKGDNGKLGYYEMYEPKKETYFWIEFTFQSGVGSNAEILTPKPISNKVLYTPYAMMEKPLAIRIPKPASKETEFTQINISEYLVKEDDIQYNDSRVLSHTFHTRSLSPLEIQLVWDAPVAKDDKGQKTIDYNLEYDIWVTEEKEQLESEKLKPILANLQIAEIEEDKQIKNQSGQVVGLKWILDSYYDKQSNSKKIVPNKTYYIKAVAKRSYGGIYKESDPTIVAITLGKDGDIFTPPILGKPPLKLKEEGVTTQTATINWLEEWYEIIAKHPVATDYPDSEELFLAQMWNVKVFTGKSNPAIHFKQTGDNKLQEHILLEKQDVKEVEAIVGVLTGDKSHFNTHYSSRKVSLGNDVDYQIKVVPHEEIQKQLNGKDISIWIQENESNSVSGWNELTPSSFVDNEKLTWKEYTIQGLNPNTSYVAMLRASRTLADGSILLQTYPSYIIFTTLSDHESPEAVPTVPVLKLEATSDTAITVSWKYNNNFEYELVYSRTDDPEKAKQWNLNFSNNPEDPNYIADGMKADVTIKGLFPDTTYNIWIRAKQKKGDKISAWSNPVTAKTDTIKAPQMPTGLGLAAYQSIVELGLDFKPAGSDYLTVEWMLNPNDLGTEVDGNIEKRYEYELEFADDIEFMDSISVVVSDETIGSKNEQYEILSKNIVKFNGLIANRPYYVRIKSRIVLKNIEGKEESKKESKQTKWVRILTKGSEGEYDGGENSNIVILPDLIEETYKNDIWTLEIVNPQGVISEILNRNEYYYTINATLYNKKYDADIRKIRIPKAVLTALIGQNMELRIITNIGKYEMKPQTLNYYIQSAQATDIVDLEFKTVWAYDARTIAKPYPYVMLKGETLNVYTKGKQESLKKLDGYIRVGIKLPWEYDLLYRGIEGYIYSTDTGTWIKQPKSIEQYEGNNYLSYTTPQIGMYATYKVDNYGNTSRMTEEMKSLIGKYGIEELGNRYAKDTIVHSDQYIRLLLGIAKNHTNIKLSEGISEELRKRAKSSGIYIEAKGGYVTEEQAISGIVRLYEMKLGYKIKPSYKKFYGVDLAYDENVSKAYAIGIIEEIRPKKLVSYEKLCEWIINAGF